MKFKKSMIKNKSRFKIFIVFIMILVVLALFYSLYFDDLADDDEEEEGFEVIEGQPIGDVVLIDERIRVTEGNETFEKIVKIKNASIEKDDTVLKTNGVLYIKNFDDRKYELSFPNHPNQAVLYEEQAYRVSITVDGTYDYIIESDELVLEGSVEVS